MKNYYAILQIPENSNHDDIQKAYRRLAKQYHPDVNKAPEAHEKFCEISEAYEFLMYEQKSESYRRTDEYERFRQESRKRAQKQAKMRYEKFQRQHEAFQESGINDIALLFTVIIRLLSVPIALCLFLLPLTLAVLFNWKLIFLILLLWPFAIAIAWYIHDNRKRYFLPGKFYYSPDRIKHLFTDKRPSLEHCYYCQRRMANSKPYKLDLLKLKEVKFKSDGYRQQNVNYVNQNISVLVPRSQKAFIIHSVNILIKLSSLFYCLIFLSISSITWRAIAGMAFGGILSRLHLLISGTKSNVNYLISYGLILRISCWILCVVLVSKFYFNPFNITTNDHIHFVIVAIIIFDSFLMQFVNLILGKYSSMPIFEQFPETVNRFNEGYIVYNDVPVISFIYPLFRWMFG